MHHEQLLQSYEEGAKTFSSWVDGEMTEVEAMEPGNSVEELTKQQEEFERYLKEEKPSHQQELFKVENAILSLQSSQRNNGRPVHEVTDAELAPKELSRKWEQLCQMQGYVLYG